MSGNAGPLPEDRRRTILYRRISRTMNAGFLLALVLMLLGSIIAITTTETMDAAVIPLRDLAGALADARAQAVADLGILILLLTPPAFVAVALFTYVQRHDWLFSGVCLVLFAILLGGVGLALL